MALHRRMRQTVMPSKTMTAKITASRSPKIQSRIATQFTSKTLKIFVSRNSAIKKVIAIAFAAAMPRISAWPLCANRRGANRQCAQLSHSTHVAPNTCRAQHMSCPSYLLHGFLMILKARDCTIATRIKTAFKHAVRMPYQCARVAHGFFKITQYLNIMTTRT